MISAGEGTLALENLWAMTKNEAAFSCKLCVPADLDTDSLTSMQQQDSWHCFLEAEVDVERGVTFLFSGVAFNLSGFKQ